ncbi:MAG: 3-oxoacyl-ACP reductase FabG [Betaproteobacteria bacterium]|nr:3-oxoacyl-ACP reductase FabG [Betaproteobacteria bacterium]
MKRALVSGGSGEIGAAICRVLAASGWEVIVHSYANPERANALAGKITAGGGRAQSVCFDVVDPTATSSALALLLQAGPIQGIVHAAGMHADAPMAGMSATQWHDVIGVSLHGFFNLVQPLLLPMLRTRWGRIVTLSSISGIIGNRGQTNYAAAKAGVDGAMRSLSLEIASRGVTVNSVAPGIIDTAMSAGAFDAERIAQLVPMKRAGTAADVAALVEFLMSEGAGYITGQVISINGGMA